MKKFVLMASILFVCALCGCAGVKLPPPDQMEAELQGFELPLAPKDNDALIYVVRPSSGAPAVSFDVYVDSKDKAEMVGYNDAQQYIYVPITSGEHTVYSKAENWAEVKVDVSPNEVVFLEQIPKAGFLFARNELKQIDEITGKYHVKQLKLGTLK